MDPERLRKLPLFASLTDEQRGLLAVFSEEMSVPDGTVLIREGDYADHLMVIEEGTARVQREGETVAEMGPGDFFGEMGLLEKDLRSASVVATSAMRLIKLTHWDVRRMRKHAEAAYHKLQDVARERAAQDAESPPGSA